MTSIYVTVPKGQERHFIKDKKEGLEEGIFTECYWKLGTTPRRVEVRKDYICFVYQGAIEFQAKITGIEYLEKGCRIFFQKIEELGDSIPVKSFRGFRYFK